MLISDRQTFHLKKRSFSRKLRKFSSTVNGGFIGEAQRKLSKRFIGLRVQLNLWELSVSIKNLASILRYFQLQTQGWNFNRITLQNWHSTLQLFALLNYEDWAWALNLIEQFPNWNIFYFYKFFDDLNWLIKKCWSRHKFFIESSWWKDNWKSGIFRIHKKFYESFLAKKLNY